MVFLQGVLQGARKTRTYDAAARSVNKQIAQTITLLCLFNCGRCKNFNVTFFLFLLKWVNDYYSNQLFSSMSTRCTVDFCEALTKIAFLCCLITKQMNPATSTCWLMAVFFFFLSWVTTCDLFATVASSQSVTLINVFPIANTLKK